MKKLFFFAAVIFSFVSLHSQTPENSNWVYRTYYEPTEEQADSVNTFTKVYIDFNTTSAMDSSMLTFTIGTSVGGSELFKMQKVYTSTIVNGTDILQQDGFIRFYLGKYLIPEGVFVVDLSIESPHKVY